MTTPIVLRGEKITTHASGEREKPSTIGTALAATRQAGEMLKHGADLVGLGNRKEAFSLLTPHGLYGFICSIAGQCIGTVYAWEVAPAISRAFMKKVMEVGCEMTGRTYISSHVARYGGYYIAEKAMEPIVVCMGGAAGSYALIIVGNMAANVAYKLCFSDPKQKAVVQEYVPMDKLPSELQ